MPHILISKRIAHHGIELLERQRGYTIDALDEPSDALFTERLAQADAVILFFQPLTRAHIVAAPRLRVVSRHGVGYDAVDVQALNERAIPLTITPGANATAVAEHAISLLFAAARRAVRYDREVRQGLWSRHSGTPMLELSGKRALIVGAGRIGQATAQRLLAFDVEVNVYDPLLPSDQALDHRFHRVHDLPAALAVSDFVSLHMPLTDETRKSIDARRMKQGAILVNTSRGGVVDEEALVAALASGHLAGAGLDVYEHEPPAANHPLLALDNVVLSPHVSSLTDGGLRRMSLEAAQNVIDYFSGGLRPAALVNKEAMAAC